MNSEHLYRRQACMTYQLKILVPSIAAGAILGKGGETVAQLQKESGARVKMSKATDFYPGTTERVCLVTGTIQSILYIHEFIMKKMKEKPDPNAKMAIDFDHKQPAQREKQIKILVPNSTAGMIIGKGGSYIKQIKEESGAYVQISQKSKDHALAERCITVIGEMENNKTACDMILSKIVEDPQSGSCLNVSYTDITSPVANFDPTGSPFANPNGAPFGAVNNSNTSSNGSLHSLSPTVTNSFQSSQTVPTYTGSVPLNEVPICNSTNSINLSEIIESVKTWLMERNCSDQAIFDVNSAIFTLSRYNVLALILDTLKKEINCTPEHIATGVTIPNSAMSSCPMTSGIMTPQNIYTSETGISVMGASCNPLATTTPMGVESSSFGSIESLGNGISALSLDPSFTTPSATQPGDPFVLKPEAAVFEPFQRSSPVLTSPKAAALPINNNSFGLGTDFNLSHSVPGESEILSDRQTNDATKIAIEVGENIIGAVLGPGGKFLVEIQRCSGANIQISKKGTFAPGTRNRIVTITGISNSVNVAQFLIQQQIVVEEGKRAAQQNTGTVI